MWNNGHDAYLESRVMTADPVELIHLLYEAGIQAVGEARAYLAAGQIVERSREITKACAIVSELVSSLDHERGGEISQRLAQLYDYILRRLITANLEQSDAQLEEVHGLLVTLSEGWAGVRPAEAVVPQPETPAESVWSQPVAPEPEVPVDSPWAQRQQESAFSYSYGYGAQAEAVADVPSSEAPAAEESIWAQPAQPVEPEPEIPADSPWAQPLPQESAYAYSYGYGSQDWSL